jgi:hypothetical protein
VSLLSLVLRWLLMCFVVEKVLKESKRLDKEMEEKEMELEIL